MAAKTSNKKPGTVISPEVPTYEFETKVLWSKAQSVERTIKGEKKTLTNVNVLLTAEGLPLRSIKSKLGDKFSIFQKEIREAKEGQDGPVIFMSYTPEFGRKGSSKEVTSGNDALVKFSVAFGKNKDGEDVCYRNIRFLQVFESEPATEEVEL